MFRHARQLLSVIAVALLLAACIYSDYRIAPSFEPQFPIKPGTYVRTDSPAFTDKVIDVSRVADTYRVYSRTDKTTNYARLFRIPEASDFVLQYYRLNRTPIAYLFLRPTEKGFQLYVIEKSITVAPEHLKAFIAPEISNGQKTDWIRVVNGRRDTAYIVRELARANLNLELAASFERRR